MLKMETVDEVISSPSSDSTPLPLQVGEARLPCAQPTPTAILEWIFQSAGQPWFPSQHAATTGIDRDAFDEPLSQLRLIGLIQIATWERGIGQGYLLTPEGENVLAAGTGLPTNEKVPEPLSSGSLTAIPDQPPTLTVVELELTGDSRSSIVVPALLIANFLWFCAGLVAALWGGYFFWNSLLKGNSYLSHRLGSVSGLDLLRGEWWRLLTTCFVHAGLIHLLANLFALAVIGPLAEHLWGRRQFFVIYLLSGLGGSCLAMALYPGSALVGASGAIWGVLMSLVVWFVAFRVQIPSDVTIDVTRRLALAIGLNVAVSFLPGISWQSHLGGAVVGVLAASLLNIMRFGSSRRRRLALAFLAALPVFIVGSLVIVMGRGENWKTFRERVAGENAREAALKANKTFDQEIAPRLKRVSPEIVKPVQRAAGLLLLHPKTRRNAATLGETQSRLTELKSLADQAAELLSLPPVGVEAIDQRQARAREYAQVQSHSLNLLLDMIAADAIPNEAAWTAWGNSKRAAENLWEQIWLRK